MVLNIFYLIIKALYLVYNIYFGLLKSDSILVYSNGYKPRSFRPRANAKTLYSRAGGPSGGYMRYGV